MCCWDSFHRAGFVKIHYIFRSLFLCPRLTSRVAALLAACELSEHTEGQTASRRLLLQPWSEKYDRDSSCYVKKRKIAELRVRVNS